MSARRVSALSFLLFAVVPLSVAADLPGASADGWFSWRVEAVDSAPELCCFAWEDGIAAKKSCNLDSRHGGFHTSSDSPFLADEIRVYAFLNAGSASKIRVLSAHCPVTSKSVVADLGLVAVADSVGWLQQRLTARDGSGDEAIAAVALHAGDEARRLLVDTATSDGDMDNREAAIFWMAQSRIDETAEDLRKIMFGDRNADIRQHAAFSYSQSTAVDRAELLIRQAREDADAEVRSQALFWLAQTESAVAFGYIERLLSEDQEVE